MATLHGMLIQVRSNHTVQTSASLEQWVRKELTRALERFQDELSSLEVHLADINSGRVSEDHKRCAIEARLNGRDPVAVHHQAERLDDALHGAVDKLKRSLERELGKQHDLNHRRRESIRRSSEPDLG